MAIFKCKMCGGSLEIASGTTVIECEYCGTQQTLPKLNDDRRANMYDRANHFRRNNDFDKAMGIYEQILNEDNTDAEAYWSLVLCRYGIDYVEDPTSHKRIPTVNRVQFTSIFDDEDYKSALKNADSTQRAVYEAEAKAINEIQKGILAISQKEEPFDVFICYKESDASGRRTPDSVLAQELYFGLKNEGFKVFFARITLEDKLGSAYEPYIFAALNSSKAMVVLGTKPEYFNAVWVKNEWSRYLALIKQGQKKVLIPAYKDMDPYDLPEEFSHLQAQDMTKLGFMQDLIRGITKIVKVDEPKQTVVKETIIQETVAAAGVSNVTPLLKRAFMFLEDENWDSANDYSEKVLDLDPENAQAYFVKFLADFKLKNSSLIAHSFASALCLEEDGNYQKAMRFADANFRTELQGYIDATREQCKLEDYQKKYNDARNQMQQKTSASYALAAEIFGSIPEYQDAKQLKAYCVEQSEICRKDEIYAKAMAEMDKVTIDSVNKAITIFQSISGWKDADKQASICALMLPKLQKKEEEKRITQVKKANKRKKLIIVCSSAIASIIALSIAIPLISSIILKNSFDNGTFSAEFVKGPLNDNVFAYSVIEQELEQCKKNNDAKTALYYICELSEAGLEFACWGSRPSIYIDPAYAQWLLDYASQNGSPVETQINQVSHLDYYSYSIDGYSVTFTAYLAGKVIQIDILTTNGWSDATVMDRFRGWNFVIE